MILKNNKGMTLIELMVVVILIAGMVALAYPTYVSALEKSRALEAVRLVSHLVAGQEKFKADCFSMNNDGSCNYATSFKRLPVQASGQDKEQDATTVTDSNIVTAFFTYSFSGNAIVATPKTKYKYTLKGTYGQDIITCNTTDESGVKICSALGKQVGSSAVYNIQ